MKQKCKIDCQLMYFGILEEEKHDMAKKDAKAFFYEHFNSGFGAVKVYLNGEKLNTAKAIKFFGPNKATSEKIIKTKA